MTAPVMARMPRRIFPLLFSCLVFASPAVAGSTWLGAQLHFPTPACDVGNTQLGVDAGATITLMSDSYLGMGADVVYHYWPASSEYVGAFNRYLTTTRLEALTGSEWALSSWQITGHVKVAVPAGKLLEPWMKLGAGAYRLNYNLDPHESADRYITIQGSITDNIRFVPGAYGSIGLDFRSSSPVVFGMDAAFHYVSSGEKSPWGFAGINDLQDFSAITVGLHASYRLK